RRHSAAPSMRAGTDADVVLVAPVSAVVAGFLARSRIVADLVRRQARCLGPPARQPERLRPELSLAWIARSMAHVGGEPRVWLDRELVQREMAGAEGQGTGQFGVPLLRRLTGPGIDQVEAYAPEMTLRDFERGETFADVMESAEEAQRLVVERLHPERDTVDAGRGELGKIGRLDRRRIGFERDLDVWREAP